MYYSTILSFVASTEQKAAATATLYVLFQPVIVVNMSQNVTELSLSESCPSLASAQGIRFQFPLLNQWILSTQPLIPQSPRTIDFFYCHPKSAALCFSLFLILFSGSSMSQKPHSNQGHLIIYYPRHYFYLQPAMILETRQQIKVPRSHEPQRHGQWVSYSDHIELHSET